MTFDCEYCRTRYQAERCPSCGAPPTAHTPQVESMPSIGTLITPDWVTKDALRILYGVDMMAPTFMARVS